MRRPGYFIAALVVAVAALTGWFFLFSGSPAEPLREAPAGVEVPRPEPEPEPALEPASEPASEPEPAPEAPAAPDPAETDPETIECRLDVERWDSGDRARVIEKYGESAEAVVEGCRAIPLPAQ